MANNSNSTQNGPSTNVLDALLSALTFQTANRRNAAYCICSVIFDNARGGANSRKSGSFAFADLVLTLTTNL